ncbi:MAG: peptidylprolyl isomerase [Gammaproteobacteria bacterium]|nr:peptidylprolyl isomerase [Gammaproteobacteria bacterium]
MRPQAGSKVSIVFTLSLEDGTEVDAASRDEPLVFTLGDGTMIEKLEEVIAELTPGERHTYLLGPDEAFGYPDEENVHSMPKSDFPDHINLEQGQVIGFTTPTGEEVPGTIDRVDGESVLVDFNHPLAGRNLAFEVELISVEAP